VNQLIYLDNNASTQVDERVINAMIPFLTTYYSNANSPHQLGIRANEAVKNAREQVSRLIGSSANEIVFTSGATEAINIAIKGVAEKYSVKGRHIVTVSTEHQAVLDTCHYLESKGFEVSYLSVDKDGVVDVNELKDVLRKDTILVSIMLVNNEIGVIQPIKECVELTHSVDAFFFSDCTQAVGKIPINVDDLDIDLLCFSGHKMYAPKGNGALYTRQRGRKINLTPLFHGGGQEGGLRSGTLNVSGIVSLGTACTLAQNNMNTDSKRISELRDLLELEILKLPNTYVNGSIEKRIFNVTNICFKGLDADILIGKIKNVAVSNGSACTSSVLEPSHVLKAIGLSDEDAFASIRFSLGKFNTIDEIKSVIKNYRDFVLNYNKSC
jgi:cysteine desulfurase